MVVFAALDSLDASQKSGQSLRQKLVHAIRNVTSIIPILKKDAIITQGHYGLTIRKIVTGRGAAILCEVGRNIGSIIPCAITRSITQPVLVTVVDDFLKKGVSVKKYNIRPLMLSREVSRAVSKSSLIRIDLVHQFVYRLAIISRRISRTCVAFGEMVLFCASLTMFPGVRSNGGTFKRKLR